MKILRVEGVRAIRLTGIRCDRCGAEVRLDSGLEGLFTLQECLSIEFTAGYGAKAFDDGTHYSCELCETCVKDLLGSYLRSFEPRWNKLLVSPNPGRNPVIE